MNRWLTDITSICIAYISITQWLCSLDFRTLLPTNFIGTLNQLSVQVQGQSPDTRELILGSYMPSKLSKLGQALQKDLSAPVNGINLSTKCKALISFDLIFTIELSDFIQYLMLLKTFLVKS